MLSNKKVGELKQNAVICLAAGALQERVIIIAKKLGYIVIAVDKDPNAPGFKHTDLKIYQSTYDASAIIKELDLLKDEYQIIGILNRSSGPPVVTAARLCEYLNISGLSVESAQILVNKDRLRAACLEHDILSPKYEAYNTSKQKQVSCDEFPVVVKPALSLIGKSGISVVGSKEMLSKSIECAIKHTINGKIVIEEFLPGPDLSLVSFVKEGRLCPICLLDEINTEKEDGTISGRGFKVHDSAGKNKWPREAHKIAQKIISTFNIERSALMISFRVDSKRNLRLIEIHLDLGGDLLIEEIYPKALPFNFLELAVGMAIGNTECPNNYDIKPTAIFYDDGEGLLTSRGYQVFTANSHQMLDRIIRDAEL